MSFWGDSQNRVVPFGCPLKPNQKGGPLTPPTHFTFWLGPKQETFQRLASSVRISFQLNLPSSARCSPGEETEKGSLRRKQVSVWTPQKMREVSNDHGLLWEIQGPRICLGKRHPQSTRDCLGKKAWECPKNASFRKERRESPKNTSCLDKGIWE